MNEEMYELLHEIIEKRAARSEHNAERWVAYTSMLDMLEYAHNGNYECLCQFNY